MPDNWKRIDASGKFQFSAPPDLQESKVVGIDSFVRQYSNDQLQINCDYGKFSGITNDKTLPGFDRQEVKIDGKSAVIVTTGVPGGEQPLYAFVNFPELAPGRKLGLTIAIRCKTPQDQDTAKTIFHSVTFPAAP